MPATSDRRFHALLATTVGLPLLAFAYGTLEGRVAFVLFRNRKTPPSKISGGACWWSSLGVAEGMAGWAPFGQRSGNPLGAWLALFLAFGAVKRQEN